MKHLNIVWLLAVGMLVAGCGNTPNEPQTKQEDTQPEAVETNADKSETIEAVIKDDTEFGVATLTETDSGVKVNVKVDHFQPGSYGIHIHEAGVCEAPDFETAGGHFNPDDREHGFYQKEGPHKGDMENLQVEEDGAADQTYVNELVTLKKGKKNSLRTEEGTSIIIHEHEDDYLSQPAGDAGGRTHCAVISPPEA